MIEVKESIEELRNSYELRNSRGAKRCLDKIEEELNKMIDDMAKTIISDTVKLDTFWCNGCFKIAECPFENNTKQCVINYFEKEIENERSR